MSIDTEMTTTQILIDDDELNRNGRVYEVTNYIIGNRTLLPLATEAFILFLKNLFKEIEIDDYAINSRCLAMPSYKNTIDSMLQNIFKTNCFDFKLLKMGVTHEVQSSSDFFDNVECLLKTNALLQQFILTSPVPEIVVKSHLELPVKPEPEAKMAYSFAKNPDNMNGYRFDPPCFDEVPKKPKTGIPNIDAGIVRNQDDASEAKSENFVFKRISGNNGSVQRTWDDYVPFNTYYESSIYGTFAKTCMLLSDSIGSGDKCKATLSKCSVIYSIFMSQAFVIEHSDDACINYLVKYFNDFKLMKTYDELTPTQILDVRSFFHKREFENEESVNTKIKGFESVFDIGKPNTTSNTGAMDKVEQLILLKYWIHKNRDGSEESLVKASVIVDSIRNDLRIDLTTDQLKLTKLVSSVLLKMGLNKKRKSDGIYYYNISTKEQSSDGHRQWLTPVAKLGKNIGSDTSQTRGPYVMKADINFVNDVYTPLTNHSLDNAIKEWLYTNQSAIATYGHISKWNTKNITDMSCMFSAAAFFNDDISEWDVSNVTDMNHMFSNAAFFKQDISKWNVSNVTNMNGMFAYAASFNCDISKWNTETVSDMRYMFAYAAKFRTNLDNWDITKINNTYGMFYGDATRTDLIPTK